MSPSPPRNNPEKLDAGVEAPGPHDFAVRLRHVRRRAIGVHRIPPRVDDVAQRPLVGRDGEHIQLIRVGRKHFFAITENIF